MAFTFSAIEPSVAYEYRVSTPEARIGRVRKETAKTHPYAPTGRWIADDGAIQKGGFRTRREAAEWLASWLRTSHHD